MTHEQVTIRTEDGECPSHVLTPEGRGPWPAAIFYHDGFGMRPAMVAMAQRLADAGYLVLLPDLYYRFGAYAPLDPRELTAMGTMMDKLGPLFATTGTRKVSADTAAYLAWLDRREDVSGPGIGITGYCMGGALTLTVAGDHPDRIVAAASFHGGNLVTEGTDSPHLAAARARAKLYIAYAVDDPWCPPEAIATLERALGRAGVNYRSETYGGARHGWAVPDSPHHDAAAAERHWDALTGLFDNALRDG